MEQQNKLTKSECVLEYILKNDDGVGIALGYGSREMIEKYFKDNKKYISENIYEGIYNYMYDEHSLILLNEEISEIIYLIEKNKFDEKFIKQIFTIIKSYGSSIPDNVKISLFNDIINHLKK